MSTRSTIARSKSGDTKFHLFRDLQDGDGEFGVYLELCGKDLFYSASPDSILVKIPGFIWEFIGGIGKIDSLDLLVKYDMTDEEIRKLTETIIDERIKEYEESTNPKIKALVNVAGCWIYGNATSPREEQIASGVSYFRKIRGKMAEVISKSKEIVESI